MLCGNTRSNLYPGICLIAIFIVFILAAGDSSYDFMFIIEATKPMKDALPHVKTELAQLFDLIKLTKFFKRVSIIVYRDCCCIDNLIEWSDWKENHEVDCLNSFLQNLNVNELCQRKGPAAVKSSLMKACQRIERKTLCFFYFQSSPYHPYKNDNWTHEQKMRIEMMKGEHENWLTVCETLLKHDTTVFTIYSSNFNDMELSFYTILAGITGGKCIRTSKSNISKTIISIILNLCGCEYEYDMKTEMTSMNSAFFHTSKFLADKGYNGYLQTSLMIIIPAKDEFRVIMKNLTGLLKSDEKYAEIVLAMFLQIMKNDNMSISTIKVIFDDTRELIWDPFKNMMIKPDQNLTGLVNIATERSLKEFNEQSCDRIKEMKQFISPSCNCQYIFYVTGKNEDVACESFSQIETYCSYSSLQVIFKLLRELSFTYAKPSSLSGIKYIRAGLDPDCTFKMLSHLICTGVVFRLRMCHIVASICVISGSMLKHKAIRLLRQSRGKKWIDFARPENNTYDFALIMNDVSEYALTGDEKQIFEDIIKICSLKKIKSHKLNVQVGCYKTERVDYKNKCKKCNQWRSTTLLTDMSCSICIYYENQTYEDDNRDLSLMSECSKCSFHFAIYDHASFENESMCYFCSRNETADFIECRSCFNKFIYQLAKPLPNFICSVCNSKESSIYQKHELTVEEYIEANGADFLGMSINDTKKFFDSELITTPEERKQILCESGTKPEVKVYNHLIPIGNFPRKVLNVEELQLQIFDAMKSLKRKRCMFCLEEFNVEDLRNVCGRIKMRCTVLSCEPCLRNYYQEIKPGKVIYPAQIYCPFCKNIPLLEIVNKYNPMLVNIINPTILGDFDYSLVYAWCIKCNNIKSVMKRKCSDREIEIEIENLECDDCKKLCGSNAIYINSCPSCNWKTEINIGSSYIHCENNVINNLGQNIKCDTYWCKICGFKASKENIYRNFACEHNEHNGFYQLEDGEKDESEDGEKDESEDESEDGESEKDEGEDGESEKDESESEDDGEDGEGGEGEDGEKKIKVKRMKKESERVRK